VNSQWERGGRAGKRMLAMSLNDLLGGLRHHRGRADRSFFRIRKRDRAVRRAHGHAFVYYGCTLDSSVSRREDVEIARQNFFLIRGRAWRLRRGGRPFLHPAGALSQPLNIGALPRRARQSLTRLYTALRNGPHKSSGNRLGGAHAARFRAAMDDDFNTAEAVAVLFDLANEANRGGSSSVAGLLRALGKVLGLLERDPAAFLQAGSTDDASKIEALIGQRAAAKKSKDYAQADRIRAELLASGIVLEDTAQGTIWRRA